jgi:beta-galactosidase
MSNGHPAEIVVLLEPSSRRVLSILDTLRYTALCWPSQSLGQLQCAREVLLFHCRVFLLFVFAIGSAAAQRPLAGPQPVRLGAAWYPEQWPEAQWESDLQLMQDAHMNVVRIGEFAWSTLEPSEGHYELDWMDRAIALAAKHHIAVVIGTPTDAPPAWLTTKYPNTLGMNADGHLREHGSRRQFNYASPRYRQLCALIVTQLARRLGHNPNVIGWQIGNEYSDESFDPATRALFQQFLREKYKTLDNLNRQWATAYWSQTYSAWSQIPMENSGGNPGLLLEHKHFVTATWRSFQRAQIDVLRPAILPAQFITTNIGGLAWSDNWDHYAITADLDLASWDDYVGQGHLDAAKNAMLNDFVRGWKRQNFWVMETEPGSVNWAPVNNALWPGETRALAWQTIGHGADAVLYWQWRDALNGQEQYHGAIVGPDGKPLPIYAEIAQLGKDLELTREALAGTSPHAEVAILHDYDSRWAIDFQPHTKEYDQQQVLLRFYEPLRRMEQAGGRAVDIVNPKSVDLTGYKLLVAPSLNVIDDALAAKLLAYVQHGGHLLLGPRSGMKDEFNSLNPQRQPGPLVDTLGGRVEQYYALEKPVTVQLEHPGQVTEGGCVPVLDAGPGACVTVQQMQELERPTHSNADIWAEMLSTSAAGTHVVLRYGHDAGWLADKPAMIERTVGKGSIAYLGTLPDAPFLNRILVDEAQSASREAGSNAVGTNVEICERTAGSGADAHHVVIVINHNDHGKWITLGGHLRSLLPGIDVTYRNDAHAQPITQFTLDAQAVAVLVPQEQQ